MKNKRKSSGIIIIGNEILSGKTLDTNSNFMCKELFKKGISCNEINITRDENLRVVEKINLFRSLVPNYEIYLIDEPENGLDNHSKNDLDKKLNLLSKKSTIIYTSHNSNSLSIYKKTTKEIIL